MASPKVPKDKFFEKVINPYLAGVLQHPQSIEMHEGVLHIRDVEGPKKTGSVEARLEAMEQQVFKCQGMVERGLNANHMMITEFTNKHKIDANDIGKHLSRLYDRIDHLQAQIYDLQNQNSSDVIETNSFPMASSSLASSGDHDSGYSRPEPRTEGGTRSSKPFPMPTGSSKQGLSKAEEASCVLEA
ncbi:40S ribosomal protein S5-1 [Hordeum vulgare]|nr:40S ribosomal protein S5-1 [Hordeum vulgare]